MVVAAWYSFVPQGPQAVIVVPTRELGVQVVMLIFRLFGGSVNQGLPGAGANMFTYLGPRGLTVRGGGGRLCFFLSVSLPARP